MDKIEARVIPKIKDASFNDIINNYLLKKKLVLSMILSGNSAGILDHDYNCTYNLGVISHSLKERVASEYASINKKYQCQNCNFLRKFLHGKNISLNIPIKNLYLNKDIIVTHETQNEYYTYKDNDPLVKYISSFNKDLVVCKNYCTSNNSKYLRLDASTNGTIISWYLEMIIPDRVVIEYTSFFCGNERYHIKEYPNRI